MKVYLISCQDNYHRHEIPLASCYLKSYALGQKELTSVEIEIVSLNLFQSRLDMVNRFRQLVREIAENEVDIVGFSYYMWSVSINTYLASEIRKVVPHIKLIAGGPEVSPMAHLFLENNNFFDVVIRGEGEIKFGELLKMYKLGLPLDGICGISYRNSDGKIIDNPDSEPIDDLDLIPSPILTGVMDGFIDKYNETDSGFFDIELARGCTMRCAYCYFGKGFKKVSRFSISRVSEEIKYILKKNPSHNYIVLWDSNLIRDKKFFFELSSCLEIIGKEFNVYFKAEIDIYDVTKEIASALKKANINVSVGLQTTNPKALKICKRRPYKEKKFIECVSLLSEFDIRFNFELIIGLPGDTFYDVLNSIRTAVSFGAHHVNAFPLYVLPGTYLSEFSKELGLKISSSSRHLITETKDLSHEDFEDLKLICSEFIDRYNLIEDKSRMNKAIRKAGKFDYEKLEQALCHSSVKTEGVFTDCIWTSPIDGFMIYETPLNEIIAGLHILLKDKTTLIISCVFLPDFNKLNIFKELLDLAVVKSLMHSCEQIFIMNEINDIELIQILLNTGYSTADNNVFIYKMNNINNYKCLS